MRRVLCLLLLLVPWPACAQLAGATSPRSTAQALLAASERRLGRGDLDQALDLARQAAAADPQFAPAFARLGALYQRKGLREECLDAYARALALEPTPATKAAAAEAFGQGPFPEHLARATPWQLPGTWQGGTLRLEDPRLAEAARGRHSFLVCTPDPPRPGDRATDFRYQVAYQRACYLLVMPAGADRWRLACRVHFQPGREELAGRCARLVGALALLGHAYLGRACSLRQAVDLWLAEAGRPGAEGWPDSIYLCSVGTERQPTEWIRQLAHECGHAGIAPGIGGLGEPEPWANGRAGELLFARWLLSARPAAGTALPWVTPALGAWYSQQAAAVARALAAAGPAGGGTGLAAVERAAGLVCMIEELLGPAALEQVLTQCTQPTGEGLVAALQAWYESRLPVGLELQAGAGWLHCRQGRLQVLAGQGRLGGQEVAAGESAAVAGGWLPVAVGPGGLRLRLGD